MKKTIFQTLGLTLLLVGVTLTGCQKDLNITPRTDTKSTDKLIAFNTFLQQTKDATYDALADKEDVNVNDEDEFERMKEHIAFMYEGVTVTESFELEDGRACDCIPMQQQPGLKAKGLKSQQIDTPPSENKNALPTGSLEGNAVITSDGDPMPGRLNKVDRFGNPMHCKVGKIPMVRLTLENMTHFKTLDGFFSKCESCKSTSEKAAAHRYAYTYQYVNNYGATSWLNLWKPSVPSNEFSLSQQWYAGGSGSSTQTLEGGWQVYPYLYSNDKPNLFIYFTRANYASGSGCYNLSCPGFIQTDNSWVIGGPFNYWSTAGGSQYSFRMTWYRDPNNGNWWLWLQTGTDGKWIGYYPRSTYGGGQLAYHAESIKFGGEVTSAHSTSHSGQMGSGYYANAGWGYAAYQRQIYFTNLWQNSEWSSLSSSGTPNCYTAELKTSSSVDYGTYFYYGGPGCY